LPAYFNGKLIKSKEINKIVYTFTLDM